MGSGYSVVNDFVAGICLKIQCETFSLPIFRLRSYALPKELGRFENKVNIYL